MSAPEQQLPAQARSALEECFSHLRLARATELAQSECLPEAEAVLMLDGQLPDDPRELDLLARIAARQGRFDDARRLWAKAIQQHPENEIYSQCIEGLTPARRIARIIATSQDKLLSALVWVTVAFGVGALIYAFTPER